MGTPAPDAVKRVVDHFDLGRKVFPSGGYKEEQLLRAKTPHEQESLRRQFAVTDNVYEQYGLTEEEIRIVEGDGNEQPGIPGMSANCERG